MNYSRDKATKSTEAQLLLTYREIYRNSEFTDRQKYLLDRVLNFSEAFGWEVWLNQDSSTLYFRVSDIVRSNALSITDIDALSNITNILEFFALQMKPNSMSGRIGQLEQRLARLEQIVDTDDVESKRRFDGLL